MDAQAKETGSWLVVWAGSTTVAESDMGRGTLRDKPGPLFYEATR